MKRLLLLGFATLFLMPGAWARPAAAATFDGGHVQRAAQHPRRRHHHRVNRHRHHRVHRGA
jgi:hypothetical protein